MQCRHRFTKRWICATPCDGRDDLCENNEDEDVDSCTKATPFKVILALVAAAVAVVAVAAEVVCWLLRGRDLNIVQWMNLAGEEGGNPSAALQLEVVSAALNTLGLELGQSVAVDVYEAELERSGGDVAKTDRHFFATFATSGETMAFYDGVDNGPFNRLKLWIATKVPSKAANLASGMLAQRAIIFVMLMFTCVLYYADAAKDVLLTMQFKSKVISQYPTL